MKRTLSIILAIIMIFGCFSVFSGAAESYSAKYALVAEVNGTSYSSGDTIYVKPGSTVTVKLNFSNDFYLSSVAAQIFYNSGIFSGATGAFNKDGKIYQLSGAQMCTFADWNGIAAVNRENWWPNYSASKLAAFKASHKYCYLTMTPNPMFGEPAIKNLNETLATLNFTVSSSAKDGAEGQIIIPAESVNTKTYKNGRTMCGVYKTSDMSGAKGDASAIKYDTSKAVLNFKVGSGSTVKKGDVNFDGAINSADALMVLQSSVGSKTLNANEKTAADVNSDGSINSGDALKILQYAVGEIKNL